MLESTKRYISKLKIVGISITVINGLNDTYYLDDIGLTDPIESLSIDIQNIENGNVIIYPKVLNKLLSYHKNLYVKDIIININKLNFDIQPDTFLYGLLDNTYSYNNFSQDKQSKKSIFNTFTLDDTAWKNFDRAILSSLEYISPERGFEGSLETIALLAEFDIQASEDRVNNYLKKKFQTGLIEADTVMCKQYQDFIVRLARLNNAVQNTKSYLISYNTKQSIVAIIHELAKLFSDHNNILDLDKTLNTIRNDYDTVKVLTTDKFNEKSEILKKSIQEILVQLN
jgi:hypothetical protein